MIFTIVLITLGAILALATVYMMGHVSGETKVKNETKEKKQAHLTAELYEGLLRDLFEGIEGFDDAAVCQIQKKFEAHKSKLKQK